MRQYKANLKKNRNLKKSECFNRFSPSSIRWQLKFYESQSKLPQTLFQKFKILYILESDASLKSHFSKFRTLLSTLTVISRFFSQKRSFFGGEARINGSTRVCVCVLFFSGSRSGLRGNTNVEFWKKSLFLAHIRIKNHFEHFLIKR